MSSTTIQATSPATEETLEHTCSRGDFFGLLALMLDFHNLYDVFEGLASGLLVKDILAIGHELDIDDPRLYTPCSKLESLKKEASANKGSYTALRQEYTRLFNNPSASEIAFYEGAFVNRRSKKRGKEAPDHDLLFINQAACDADRQYRRAGVKRAENMNIPGDCMLTEMAYMQYLQQLKAQALRDGNLKQLAEIDAWLAEFTRLHLKVWMKDFFEACNTLSTHVYFQALGLLGQILAQEVLEES